jgi:molybdate transport repressor ModE-like protein
MHRIIDRLEVRSEPVLYIDGRKVLDERGVRLISILDSVNSLLEASRKLGIPYSRVWEYIAKLERILKQEVIMVRRGGRGRGFKLTPEGLELVRYVKKIVKTSFEAVEAHIDVDIHIAGSDDLILDLFISEVKKKHGLTILYSKIGSLRGLSSILLGDAQIAPIHLIDPDTGEYNLPYVRKLGLERYVAILYGYFREVGFIHRQDIKISTIEDIIEGGYRIVNRCRGSGIKVLLDKLIYEYAASQKLGIKEVINMLKGYEDEVDTHQEAISKILEGATDIAIGLRREAETHNLDFEPITWERFDFIITREIIDTEKWRHLYTLYTETMPKIIADIRGYRVTENFGEILHP